MERTAAVVDYYRCLDEDDYETLRSLLSPEFTQQRSDRTFSDRDAFIQFMAHERPITETTHDIGEPLQSGERVAVAGRLYGPAGDELFAFIDVFRFDDRETITSLVTYS